MAELNPGKLFVSVPSGKESTFKTKHVGKGSSDAYFNKIVFLEGTGEIITHGVVYAENKLTNVAALEAILAGFGASQDDPNKTVAAAIQAAKESVTGTATVEGKTLTVGAVSDRVAAIEKILNAGGTDDDNVINTLQEVLNWFSGVSETGTGEALLADVAANKSAIGTKASGSGDSAVAATGLYKYVDDAQAAAEKHADDAIAALDSSVTAKDASEYVTVTIAEADGKLTETGSSVAVKTAASSSLVSAGAAGEVKSTTTTESTTANVAVSYNTLAVADASTAEGLATVADLSAKYKADMDLIVAALNAQAKKIATLEYNLQWETYVD